MSLSDGCLLVVKGVSKSFGGLWALDGVNLGLKKGEMALLMGPNGSGKTTLVNVISGVYRPDGGRVFFNGLDITGLPPHEIYGLGVVRTFQIPQPFLKLTVLENLLVADRGNPGEGITSSLLKGRWLKKELDSVERALRFMEILRLDEVWDREAYKLSGGQLKLLEVGRALMGGAKVLLMDEPAGGINPVLAHEVFQYLRDLNERTGVAMLIIEHRLDLAIQYVKKAYAMSRGKIIAEGEPQEIVQDAKVVESYLGA